MLSITLRGNGKKEKKPSNEMNVDLSKRSVAHLQVWYRPLDGNHMPSQLHGHDPWLLCEVALRYMDLKWLLFPTNPLS